MARVSTKIGDVFSVKLDDGSKKYFQLIAFDSKQLNSDVIRGFKKEYPLDSTPKLSDIIEDEVAFYTHCVTKFGVKFNLWEKAGNTLEIGDLTKVLFRDTNDSGCKPGEQVKISTNWYVWRINDADFTRVGKLEGENRTAEIGVIVNPYDVLDRIKTGKFNFFYPGFE
jgi:hypothetical protein